MVLVALLKQDRPEAISVLLLQNQGSNRRQLVSFLSIMIRKNDERRNMPTGRVKRFLEQSGNIVLLILVAWIINGNNMQFSQNLVPWDACSNLTVKVRFGLFLIVRTNCRASQQYCVKSLLILSQVNIGDQLNQKRTKLILCFSAKRKPVEFSSSYLLFLSVKRKKKQWSN